MAKGHGARAGQVAAPAGVVRRGVPSHAGLPHARSPAARVHGQHGEVRVEVVPCAARAPRCGRVRRAQQVPAVWQGGSQRRLLVVLWRRRGRAPIAARGLQPGPVLHLGRQSSGALRTLRHLRDRMVCCGVDGRVVVAIDVVRASALQRQRDMATKSHHREDAGCLGSPGQSSTDAAEDAPSAANA